jgi:hypothetical protein
MNAAQAQAEVMTEANLPPLPHNLSILQAREFCGDIIAISTEDGIQPHWVFVLRSGTAEWERLKVH